MKIGPILMATTLILSGCGTATDDYPRLLPTETMLAEPALPDHVPPARSPAGIGTDTAARAEALRRRADALRRPVIEPEALSRMRMGN